MMHLPPLKPQTRMLFGPGPSNLEPSVQQAAMSPIVGHLDQQFLEIMTGTINGLRHLYGTTNTYTLPVSGTGSAGLDALLMNLLEPGDDCIVCVIGYFGQRLVDMATRTGANVRIIEVPLGEITAPEQLEAELRRKSASVVALVHAETSTGACQPLKEMAETAHRHGALLVADCVTSLGGMPIDLDAMGVDAAGSCTQKCLGSAPGLAPISLNERALERIRRRKTQVPSWYLDLSMLMAYWEEGVGQRMFHHTAPILSVYSLYEALRVVFDEGLESRYRRHRMAHETLVQGLEEMGLSLFTPVAHRLPMLHIINVPAGVDGNAVRGHLLEQGIEIADGFGPLAGKAWRVGLMGYNATCEKAQMLLVALKGALEAVA